MSQVYAPLIHIFAPEIQEVDIGLRRKKKPGEILLGPRNKYHKHDLSSGPTIGDL